MYEPISELASSSMTFLASIDSSLYFIWKSFHNPSPEFLCIFSNNSQSYSKLHPSLFHPLPTVLPQEEFHLLQLVV